MALFRPSYLKEGRGIEKDAPPKKGLALFFEILVREFWQILKLNLLFFVCALPIVTFGAARAALSRCTVNMVRDIPNDVWYDFRRELKKDFARNTLFGVCELLWAALLLLALSHPAMRGNLPLLAAVFAAALLGGLFFGYLWPMAVTVDLPVRAVLKNAFMLAIACLQHSLPALLINAVLLGLSFWLFPLSLPIVLLIPFGIGSFVTSFAAWSDIRRLVIKENQNTNGTEENND